MPEMLHQDPNFRLISQWSLINSSLTVLEKEQKNES